MDTEMLEARKKELMERAAEYKEMIENRTFDEHDVRRLLRLFIDQENYPNLYRFNKLCQRRQKDQILQMMEITDQMKEHKDVYQVLEDSGADDQQYEILSNELIKFGQKYNIQMNELIIKEIIVCIYSLLQLTRYKRDPHQHPYARFCIVLDQDALIFGLLYRQKVIPGSIVKGIHAVNFTQKEMIVDPVRFERIDGKLQLMNESKEVIAEVEES